MIEIYIVVTHNAPMQRLLNSKEVAEVLQVPARLLDQWSYLGRGPAFTKVGRQRRYSEEDVQRYLTARRVQPPEDAA